MEVEVEPLRFKSLLSKVKRNIYITATWFNTILIFLTLASLAWNYITLLKAIFPFYWMWMVVCIPSFFVLYTVLGEFIIRLRLYEAERTYDMMIDPYAVWKLTEKEKIVYRASLMNLKTILAIGRKTGSITPEMEREFENAISRLERLLEAGGKG